VTAQSSGSVDAARTNAQPRWQVSLTLPIEAPTRAEAVLRFWAFVRLLGPEQLPAFVWPAGDELAMQAYVLEHPVSLDPEADEE
jgi:hypothetical protein